MSDSLEDLFSEATARALAAKAPKAPPKYSLANSEGWQRTRGIALIHRDTDTLLGNFSEYVHLTIPSARKLIRESAPISVSATEYVEGSWWVAAERKPEPRQAWHEVRQIILHVVLRELRLHSPICELAVHLSYGAIARVELACDTLFAQTEGTEQFLELPAGTNILEMLDLEAKLAVRKEAGI